MFRISRWYLAVVVSLFVAHAAPAAQPSIAVMPLVAKRVPVATVEILDDLLVNELGQRAGATVIGAQDINAILGLERMKDALGCGDVSCAAEIGGALGVEALLTGSVSTLGGEVIVSLTIINTAAAVVSRRAQVRVGDQERFYAYAIAAAVAQLYDLPSPSPPGDAVPPRSAAAPDPPAANVGGIRFKSTFQAVTVSVRSMTDGSTRDCARAIGPESPCYIQGIPAGPATVTFVLDEKEITRDLVIQGADLERQLTLDDGHLGAVPWVIGALFIGGGAALLYAGLKMDETTDPSGESTWGESKRMAVIFGGSCMVSGLVAPFIIWAQNDPFPVVDSARQQSSSSAPQLGLAIAPVPRGANVVATLRF